MRDSFVFYRSFYDALMCLGDRQKLELLTAIMEKGLNDKDSELSGVVGGMYALIAPQIAANTKRYEDGKKGGRPKKTKTTGFKNKETTGCESDEGDENYTYDCDGDETKPNVDVDVNVDVNVDDNVDVNVNVDYQLIADMYNEICISLPKITKLSSARKKAIKARFNFGYIEQDFKKLFTLAEQSAFLKGGNNNNWQANFDWLIKDSNMAKTLDGNYADKAPTQSKSQNKPQGSNIFMDMLREEERI